MTKFSKTEAFFNMNMVTQVVAMKDLEAAKKIATDAIKAAIAPHPDNVRKAESMVINATTVKSLALAMSNFMLSHSNLRVIK